MQVTVTVPDQFAEVSENLGITPSEYLIALASQEIIRHFKEQKESPTKSLLLG